MKLQDFPSEVHVSAYKRLSALAEGAEPHDAHCGICNDLDSEFVLSSLPFARLGITGYGYCVALFRAMGLKDPLTPLPYPNGDKWLAEDRRHLCYAAAEYLLKEHFVCVH